MVSGSKDATQQSSEEFSDSVDSDLQDGYTQHDRKDMHRIGNEQQFRVKPPNYFEVHRLIQVETLSNILLYSLHNLCIGHMGNPANVRISPPFVTLSNHRSNTRGLIAGGRAGLLWSPCWSYAGQFFIVFSIAEMTSMAPTAGGQYHWVSEFAPRNYQKILSYVSGKNTSAPMLKSSL